MCDIYEQRSEQIQPSSTTTVDIQNLHRGPELVGFDFEYQAAMTTINFFLEMLATLQVSLAC
jgi:hypothetical protein